MARIAIDSNFVISLLDTDDPTHAVAVALAEKFRAEESEIIVPNLILYEVLTVLSMKGHKDKAMVFYELTRADPQMRVVYADDTMERRIMTRFQDTRSKNISFADCALTVIAEEVGADAIASFDAHIKQMSKNIPVVVRAR